MIFGTWLKLKVALAQWQWFWSKMACNVAGTFFMVTCDTCHVKSNTLYLFIYIYRVSVLWHSSCHNLNMWQSCVADMSCVATSCVSKNAPWHFMSPAFSAKLSPGCSAALLKKAGEPLGGAPAAVWEPQVQGTSADPFWVIVDIR